MKLLKTFQTLFIATLVIIGITVIFSVPTLMRCTGEVDPNVRNEVLIIKTDFISKLRTSDPIWNRAVSVIKMHPIWRPFAQYTTPRAVQLYTTFKYILLMVIA